MRTLFTLIVAVIAISVCLSFLGSMNGSSMVVAIVAISVIGGILREFVKSRKELNSATQKDLADIKQRIAQIEIDIADIKDQIADFIIKQI